MVGSSCWPWRLMASVPVQRRRQRSWWRHEQQTVAAVLATFQHRLSPTGTEEGQDQGGESREEVHGDDPDASSSPTRALQPVQRALRYAARGLSRSRRPRRVRHSGSEMDFLLVVQILDARVPQVGASTCCTGAGDRSTSSRSTCRGACGSCPVPETSFSSVLVPVVPACRTPRTGSGCG